MDKIKVDRTQLEQAYVSSDALATVCDALVTAQFHNDTLTVGELEKMFAEQSLAPLRRTMLIAVLREIEAMGYGRYVVGRYTAPSHFAWSADPFIVATVARGDPHTLDADRFVDTADDKAKVVTAETKIIHKWSPITDLPDDWQSLAEAQLPPLYGVWQRERKKLQENHVEKPFMEKKM